MQLDKLWHSATEDGVWPTMSAFGFQSQ